MYPTIEYLEKYWKLFANTRNVNEGPGRAWKVVELENWPKAEKARNAMWQHSTRFKAIRVPLKMHIHTEVIFLGFKNYAGHTSLNENEFPCTNCTTHTCS